MKSGCFLGSCTSCFSTEGKRFWVRADKNISEHVFIVTAGCNSGFTDDTLQSSSIQNNPNTHFLCLCWCKLAVWPKTQCLPNKPNFPQPTSATVLIPVPNVLQNQALQSVSWLCCISRHFVRSAADISLLSTCNPVVHASPQQVSVAASQKKKETTSNNVILWPLLLFSNSAGLWGLRGCTWGDSLLH